ncbi:MAG: metalloregulator ArsR/SmtB family transcription factor [Cyclobacteriaceae bacterium]
MNNTCIRVFADTSQISRCKEELVKNEFSELTGFLNLTGNVVRLKILYLLKQENELCPCDLSDILGMTVPAISQHLKKLKEGGMVTNRKSGQTIFYSIEGPYRSALNILFDLLPENKIQPSL